MHSGWLDTFAITPIFYLYLVSYRVFLAMQWNDHHESHVLSFYKQPKSLKNLNFFYPVLKLWQRKLDALGVKSSEVPFRKQDIRSCISWIVLTLEN